MLPLFLVYVTKINFLTIKWFYIQITICIFKNKKHHIIYTIIDSKGCLLIF